MQTLEVISVNIWQILISLANLLIMYLIIKKFLFKPVQKVFAERNAQIEKQYSDAAHSKESAERDAALYEQKLAQGPGLVRSHRRRGPRGLQWRPRGRTRGGRAVLRRVQLQRLAYLGHQPVHLNRAAHSHRLFQQ